MRRQVITELDRCCDHCPFYIPDETDEVHGCIYYPPRCDKMNRSISEAASDNAHGFPIWCPLEIVPGT